MSNDDPEKLAEGVHNPEEPTEADPDPSQGTKSVGQVFAPAAELTDGREPWDWKSKWARGAWLQIAFETIYIVMLLAACAVLFVLVWRGSFRGEFSGRADPYINFQHYAYAALGGVLGGTLFDLKWLYHSVARGGWHQDRVLWRLFTPIISGGLAFATIALVSSGVFPLVNGAQIRLPQVTVGLAFLIGYFSDKSIGALNNLVDRMFKHPSPGR